MSFGSYSLLHSIWLGLEMLRYFQYSENIFLIIIIFYGPKKVISFSVSFYPCDKYTRGEILKKERVLTHGFGLFTYKGSAPWPWT